MEARRSRVVDVVAPSGLRVRQKPGGQVQAPARRGLGEVRVEELQQTFRGEAIRERSRGVNNRARRAQVEGRV